MQAGLAWLTLQTLVLGSGMLLLRACKHAPPAAHRWGWPVLLWLSIFLPTARWWWSGHVLGAALSPSLLARWEWPLLVVRPATLLGLAYLAGFAWRLAAWLSNTTFVFAFRQMPPGGRRAVLRPPLPTLLMDTGCLLLWFHPLAHVCRQQWQLHTRRARGHACSPSFILGAAAWLLTAWTLTTWPSLRQAATAHLDEPAARLLSTPLFELGAPVRHDTTPWHVQWGHLRLPLEQGADGRLQGDHTVLAQEWQRIRHEAPRLFHGDTEVAVQNFQVTLWQADLGTVRAMPWQTRRQSWSSHQDPASLVGWQLYLQAEGAVVHSLVVHVANPDALYYPPVPLPELPDTDERWPFQVVSLPGRKTTVRLDTTVASARRLLEVYTDTTRYELVHVPGFRTLRRLVSEQDDLFVGTRLPAMPPFAPPIDPLKLNEYPVQPGQYAALCIGNLCAAPELSLIRTDEWQGDTWLLQLGTDALSVAQAELIVAAPGSRPLHYWLTDDVAMAFERLRAEAPTPASFYLQNLVVRDRNGDLWHVPLTFAFHTAAQGLWVAQVASSARALPALPLRFDTTLTIEGSLRQLLAEACDLRPNRLALPPELADTNLVCRLYLSKEALPAQRRILLETLRKHLALSIGREWLRPDNHFSLITDEEMLLQQFAADDTLQRELARTLALESPWYEPLGPLTLEELGQTLETRFGIYVSLWRPPSGKYWFALPLHDLDQTIEVLRQQYGLSLEQTFRPLQMVVVKY